jgi:D-sedoheptulose 7-phosphate isomerase
MTGPAPGDSAPTGSIETLYPFLYPDQADGAGILAAVLESVRASTVAKAEEILRLRREVRDAAGPALVACAREMAARFERGGRLFAFGNGGSATDAQQLATLFLSPAASTARPLPALSLASDPAVLTALCNDIGVDVVFARQLGAFGTSADIAVALSTSGNSENLLCALTAASQRGMLTIGIAGYSGGKMAELDSIDYLFVAPSASVHRIQEAQTTMYHALWELCQAALEPAAHQPDGQLPGTP